MMQETHRIQHTIEIHIHIYIYIYIYIFYLHQWHICIPVAAATWKKIFRLYVEAILLQVMIYFMCTVYIVCLVAKALFLQQRKVTS